MLLILHIKIGLGTCFHMFAKTSKKIVLGYRVFPGISGISLYIWHFLVYLAFPGISGISWYIWHFLVYLVFFFHFQVKLT